MQPLWTALRGMPACLAVSSSWAKVMPPAALISSSPRVPSVPVPDRITPMAPVCRSSASDLKKRSIGRCGPCLSPHGSSRKTPSAMESVVFGGMI